MDAGMRSELLKGWALEAGFDAAGVAALAPVEYGQEFVAWLERGDHADMAWMEKRLDARLDPRRLFPGARSAICVALAYWPSPGSQPPGNTVWPHVARYARGVDYHEVMERRLQELGERVERAFPGVDWRTWVDTGPILERELAARAGLGAVGKNTLLLRRDLGSWFLLGEILLSLDLAPDEPIADLCGSCTACLDACPTGALPEPYRLDSRRCISYWTIEHRGTMPAAAREWMDGWVFGCDVCQEVCPWNGVTTPATDPLADPPVERRTLSLTDLLTISRDDYVERLRRSPLKRAKRVGLQRNAAIALSHTGGRGGEEALRWAVDRVEPEAREDVVWAWGRTQRRRDRFPSDPRRRG
jgi:epoxyqueuosine reductase